MLQKPSNYRSTSDIKILVKATENIKFFQEISHEKGLEIHEQICRYMTHKYLSSGEIVFQEGFLVSCLWSLLHIKGTIGTTFYIILRGSVSVCKYESQQIIAPLLSLPTSTSNSNLLNSPEKLRFSFKKSDSIVANHLGLRRSESIQSDLFSSKIRKDNSGDAIHSPKKNPSPEKREVLTEVRVLETGNSFGELALLENKPRAATIKCKENCHFAVLDKQFFIHILSKVG